jgi:sulfite exporter TauE/SafE
VELAAAILIIGSGTDALISLEGMATAPTADARVLAALSVVVGIALVWLGLLLRAGRAWLVAINVVAIAAFLELRSLTFVGLLSAILDFVVVALLLRTRWWFQWRPPHDVDVPGAARLPYERGGDA